MSRGVRGALLLFVLAILAFSLTAAAEEPLVVGESDVSLIPRTPGSFPPHLNETRGDAAPFAWVLKNGNRTASYDVRVTADIDVPGGTVSVSPMADTLHPGQLLEVRVTLAPEESFVDRVEGDVTIEVTNQATLVRSNLTFTLSAEWAPPESEFLPSITITFVAIATVIFIGFFATLVFERTKVPDLLILIMVGLFVGPFLSAAVGITLVPTDVLQLVTPYFAALALVIILFDGGLNLNFEQVLRRISIAFVHTMVAFVLTVVLVAAVAYFVLGYPLVIGILLGAILGGISGAVVINLVRVMSVSDETETLLTLEAVLTDVLCIIVALALIQLLHGGGGEGAGAAFGSLAAAFSIAVVIALVFGILWLKILKRLYGKPFSFMITIAALFLLYGGVEFIGGSGAMAGLMFGLVLGNKDEFARMFKMKTKFVLDEKIKQFHSELSFVVRTFFFVFLGLVFTMDIKGPVQVNSVLPGLSAYNGTAILLLIGVVVVFVVIILARILAASITVRLHPESGPDRTALWIMMGRGLAPAVLASVPFTIPAFTNPTNPAHKAYHDLMAPYQTQFLSIASLMIILTVIATTVGVVILEKRHLRLSPLEAAQLSHKQRMEGKQKRKWKKEQLEAKRQRIRLQKHQKAVAERKKRRKEFGD